MNNEQSFDLTKFNNTTKYEGLFAYAKQVTNLVLMEKYTITNMPLAGVGLSSYRMEDLDDITINKLKSEIQQQINTYTKNPEYVKDISMQIEVNPITKTNTLLVGFQIAYSDLNDDVYYTTMVVNTTERSFFFI
jgi:hypothetical protein